MTEVDVIWGKTTVSDRHQKYFFYAKGAGLGLSV